MIRLFVFLLSVFAMSLSSCTSASSVPKQVLRLNSHSEPASLDPRLVADLPSLTTGKMLFDGLTRMGEEGIEFSLADSVAISDDQKRYTFSLKETFWNDGTPVTADDFVFAWKSALHPTHPAEYAHQLFTLKNGAAAKRGEVSVDEVSVHAANAHTLVVELEHPNPYFLHLTAFPICYPVSSKKALENPSWASEQGSAFVCNGPFQLAHWHQGSELKVKRNPLYWDASVVRLDAITMSMIEDEHTELNMYENGELEWAGSPNSSIPPEALPSLKRLEETELFIKPIAGTYCFKFNTKETPFHNLKMRQAFAAAINRHSLIENILQAEQEVALSLLPPCMRSEEMPRTPLPFGDGDHVHAVALFEEALEQEGWTRETLPSITLMFSKSEKHQKTAQAVQQVWNRTFGIKIHLQSYEWNTFVDRLTKHHYQIGGRSWVSDLLDPLAFLELYKYTNDPELGGNNDTQWENARFIALLDEALVTTSEAKRKALLVEAESLLMEDLPLVPLYHSTACYLKKPYVKGVYLSELCDLDFKHAYLEGN